MSRPLRYRRHSFLSSSLKWISLVVLVGWCAYRAALIQQRDLTQNSDSEDVNVLRVVDGDTLLIEGQRRVRLLGVDTPETKHPKLPPQPFGPEATQFTKRLVEGKTVHLVFDKERFDDYQRILAFVFIDGRSLNEELVLAGLATAETQYPFRNDMKKRLIAAEKKAQAQRLGIWSLDFKHQQQ